MCTKQRVISCTLSALVVGLLWPTFKDLQCVKKPKASIHVARDQDCRYMVVLFIGHNGCQRVQLFYISCLVLFLMVIVFLRLRNSNT